jgi:pyruvate kinase
LNLSFIVGIGHAIVVLTRSGRTPRGQTNARSKAKVIFLRVHRAVSA